MKVVLLWVTGLDSEMDIEIARKWNFTPPPFSQLHLGTGGYTHKQPETQQPK